MTTDASGSYNTPYGLIEFRHTKRPLVELIERTMLIEGRPMRIATKQAAVTDLMRAGRNTTMIDQDALNDA